jgi:hypothetical protein
MYLLASALFFTALAYALMVSAVERAIKFGNDLTTQGPRFYDIPVAMEGNRTPVVRNSRIGQQPIAMAGE